AYKDGKRVITKTMIPPDELPDVIGKELAERLLEAQWQKNEATGEKIRALSGLELKIGGEGMQGFYDKILPAAANKLVKKFGAKVSERSLKTIDQTDRDVPFTVRDRDGIVVETDIQDENYAAERAREIGGTYGFDETAGETKTVPVHAIDI